MAFLVWMDDFSVGVKTIDEQHQKLIAMINDLHDAMSAGKSKTILDELLTKMKDYTVEHFGFEENLLKTNGYSDLPQHIVQHKEFVNKVEEFSTGIKSGKLLVSIDILKFLREWLSSHILKTDKQYSPFLLSKGVR